MKKLFLLALLSLNINLTAYAQREVVVIPFDYNNPEVKEFAYGISDNISESLNLAEDTISIGRDQLVSALREKKSTVDINKLNYVSSLFDTDLTIKGKLSKAKSNSYQGNYIYELEISILDSKQGKLLKKFVSKDYNIFTLQNKVTSQIIQEYKFLINDNQKNIINNNSTANIDAYLLYLKAKNYISFMTEESLRNSMTIIDKSLAIDPDFKKAQAEKAEIGSMILLYSYLQENVNTKVLENFDSYINKSLDESNLPQIYRAKSIIAYLKSDYKEALIEAKKAYEVDPNNSFSNYLIWLTEDKKDNNLIAKSLKSNRYFVPSLIAQAISEREKGNDDKALDIYQKINSFLPEQLLIDLLIGDHYLDQGQKNKAISYFQKVLKKDQENYKATLGMGRVYQENDENEKALEYYEKAIYINPKSGYPHFLIALVNHYQAKTSEAIEEYNESINLEPLNAKYYSGLGQLYYQLGKFEDSEKQYKKSIEINPNMAYAYVNLGLLYNKQKRYDEAISQITKALSIRNDYAYAYYNLGLINQEKGNNDEAMLNYLNAINIDPKNSLSYNKIGEINLKLGEDDKALENFTKAIEIEPKLISAYINISKLLVDKEKYKESISTLKTALRLKPNDKKLRNEFAKIYLNYANDLYNKNELKEAIKIINESIKLKPNDEYAYTQLGQNYFKLKMYKEAISEFKKASFINNTRNDIYHNLALSYEKLDMKKEAQAAYKKSCELGQAEDCKK